MLYQFIKINFHKQSLELMMLILFQYCTLTASNQGFVSSMASAAGAGLNMGHGRGIGHGRGTRHFHSSNLDGSTLPWRARIRNYQRSTTEQGCDLNVIALSDSNGKPLTKDVEGLSPSKTLYHLGWYTGLEMVQYCHVENPFDPQSGGAGNDNVPQATDAMCREQNALQGRITQPTNLPIKDVNRHFISCMDSRVGYAAIAAPGGDMGQFILGLGAAEYIIGYPFTPDDVLHFFQQYIQTMGGNGDDVGFDQQGINHYTGHHNSPEGKGYFNMCTDTASHTAWFAASKIEGQSLLMQKWNPLDTTGRRRLLKTCADPEHVGDTLLKAMVASENGEKEWGVRKEIAQATIRAFFAVWFDPFNSSREHLLLPVLAGEQKPSAVVNVESPEMCHPLTPLVVQKIHSVTPTPGKDLLTLGGEKDGGSESALLEQNMKIKKLKRSSSSSMIKNQLSESEAVVDDRTNVGVDPIGDGTQILVHHYLAAQNYRRTLSQFFSGIFGLDQDKLLGRMEMLAKRAAKKIKSQVAAGKPHYTASFLR